MLKSGWFHALFIAAIAHPVGSVGGRLGIVLFDVNPIVYTCFIMISASLGLLLFARPGPLGIETLRRPETWGYGILQTIIFALGIVTLLYVSATEGSILWRVSTIAIFLISMIFLGQKVNKTELLGVVAITGGIIYMLNIADVPTEDKVILILMLVFRGILQALQFVLAEFHKTNREAETFKHSARVTAIVMGVTTMMFTLLFISIGVLKQSYGVVISPTLPTLNDFFNFNAFLLAMVAGLFVVSFSKYCEFYAAKKITAKYLLAMVSLQTIFVITYENIFASLGLLELREFSAQDYTAMAVVVSGSIAIALSGIKQTIKNSKNNQSSLSLNTREYIKDIQTNQLIDETIEATLTFCHGDLHKASLLLEVPESLLQEIINDKSNDLMLDKITARLIQDNFSKKVAMSDPLTGLMNRLQFMTSSKKLLEKSEQASLQASLLFIDLDKFKPVNDTYGHDAGDFILKGVAERLLKITPQGGLVTRLGGDEFCVLLDDSNTKEAKSQTKFAQKQAKLISEEIAKPFTFKGKKITIGASVGIANYPEHGRTTEELLKHADEGMYGEKKKN